MTDRPARFVTVHGTVETTCDSCKMKCIALGEAPVNADRTIAVERAKVWGHAAVCAECSRLELERARRAAQVREKFDKR